MKIDLSCPVELTSLFFKEDTQTAELTFFNLSQQSISAMKYTLYLYDENGEMITSTEAELEGVDFKARENYSTIVGAEPFDSVEISFGEVTFEDGTVFTPEGNVTDVIYEELSDTEGRRFERLGINDACCYSSENENYWLCVCGRANLPYADSCVRCERDKQTVLFEYKSKEAVAMAIVEKIEEDEANAEAYKNELAEKLKVQNEVRAKKFKKFSIIAAIAVIILAVLYFAFRLVVGGMANSSWEKGEYDKAYSMYEMAGLLNTDKIDEISGELYGTSTTNAMQAGAFAQDAVNDYYIDLDCNLYKRNRETGEETAFEGIKAIQLSASGGYLYYINIEETKIYRMTPDGSEITPVVDMTALSMHTVANDIYFVANKLLEDGTESQNEIALYMLEAGKTEPKLVSETRMLYFDIYKDKIYFMNVDEGNKLYSMSLSGKNEKQVTDFAVGLFEVANNKLYYVDMEMAEGAMPYSLKTMSLSGKKIETLVDNTQVGAFAVSGDTVYYIDALSGALYKHVEAGAPEVVAEEAQQFFAYGDDIYYISSEGKTYLSKIEGDGFDVIHEPVVQELPEEPVPQTEGEMEEIPVP